jgi:hypothetical protein
MVLQKKSTQKLFGRNRELTKSPPGLFGSSEKKFFRGLNTFSLYDLPVSTQLTAAEQESPVSVSGRRSS